jgi:hypothetical protein
MALGASSLQRALGKNLRTDEHQQSEVICGGDYVRSDSLEAMSPLNPALCNRLEGRPVLRSPQQLRLHRTLDELGLTATVEEFNEAARRGTRSLQEPILIATCGTILAGIGQWRSALFEGTQEVNCIEYLLNEEECLEFILRYHQRRRVWNAFVRTWLALTREPILQQRALDNMRAGGRYKGSANLPDLQRIDVRQAVSSLAGVGACSVTNVKTILKLAHPRLIEALRDGTITINRAIQFCKWSRAEQLEQFIRYSEERATNKVIRRSIARPKEETTSLHAVTVLNALQQQEVLQPGSVVVRVGRHQRTVILVGRDLLPEPHFQKELKLT